ncbi:MAG: hypothetical protein JSS26_14860 [Nitrospira sp.]|nr:hypothetical protein [Nitrospira sp.]
MNRSEGADHFALLGGRVILPRKLIFDNAYLRETDSAFVGGSLIEGIGNAYSDVDVHVITDELLRESQIEPQRHYRVLSSERSLLKGSDPDATVFLIHTVIPGTHIKVDIEYRARSEIEQLALLVNDTFEYAVHSLVLLTKYMSARDMAFIHRLFNSHSLCGESTLEYLRERIGLARFRYLMYRWKASDFSVLLDILGAWDDRDWIRCADLARENMVTQFQSYTHLCGNTSYHRKWIIRYAQIVSVDQRLYERYLFLLTTSCGTSQSELQNYILSTIDFVDDLFEAGHQVLRQEPIYPSGASACEAIDEYFRSEAEAYSEMEVAYRKKAYGVRETPTRKWFRA